MKTITVATLLVALVLGLALVAAAVQSRPLFAAPSGPEGEVVFVNPVELDSMDPVKNATGTAVNVFRHLFDHLAERDREMRYVPWLAESWRPLSSTTWEFKLRRGVRFHNGDELTAEDVVFTFERIADPATGARLASFLSTIREVKALDRYTVQFVTKTPDPVLVARLTTDPSPILPKNYYLSVGAAGFERRPIGTGAFRFVEWVRDDRLVLEANPNYWQGPPRLRRLIYRPVRDASARMSMLRTGAADIIPNLKPDDAKIIQGIPNLEVVTTPSGFIIQLHLNARADPILRNEKVRQALYYAIDRESIVKNILGGYAKIVNAGVSERYFGYNPAPKPYPYDPARARELLKEVKWPDGYRLRMVMGEGRYLEDRNFMEAISEYWRKVGVPVQLEVKEWGERTRLVDEGKVSFLVGWAGSGTYVSELHIQPHFLCPTVYAGIVCNPPDPRLQTMINTALRNMDNKKREQQLRDIWAYLHARAAHLWLWDQMGAYGVNKRVKDIPFRPDFIVWMQPAWVER